MAGAQNPALEDKDPLVTLNKLQISPKPHVRMLARHNLSRQFQYEQRHAVVKITDQAHDAIKQICEAWNIGLPVYLTYAVMSAIARDAGVHTKWLEPSTRELSPESEFHEVMPSEPRTISKSARGENLPPTHIDADELTFDPLAAL